MSSTASIYRSLALKCVVHVALWSADLEDWVLDLGDVWSLMNVCDSVPQGWIGLIYLDSDLLWCIWGAWLAWETKDDVFKHVRPITDKTRGLLSDVDTDRYSGNQGSWYLSLGTSNGPLLRCPVGETLLHLEKILRDLWHAPRCSFDVRC